LFISLEAGITIGAFASAFIYDNVFSNFTYVFIFLAFIIVISIGYLFGIAKPKYTKKTINI